MSYSTRTRRSAAAAASAAISASSQPIDLPTISTTSRRRALAKKVSYAEVPVGTDDLEGSSDEDVKAEDLVDVDDPQENEDVIMKDAADDADQEVDEEDEEEAELDEETGTPSRRNPKPLVPSRNQPRTRGRGRGRGRGRPSKLIRQSRAGSPDDEAGEDGMDSRQISEEPRHSFRIHKVRGVAYEVIDDEVAMEDDEKGDEKVDENGQLLGDREYKVDTFVCPERPNSTKLYMLGIDVAKAAGHTDSSLLARRFQFLVKAYLSETEKVMLLKQGFVGGSNFHNGRPVTIYAARNIFKYMGARIIKNGRHVVDDYFEDSALEKCEQDGIESGSVVPPIRREEPGERANRGGEERAIGTPFYTAGGPTTHWGDDGIDPWTGAGYGNKRAKLVSRGIGPDNWMWKMASTARQWEDQMKSERLERMMDLGEARGLFAWHTQYGQVAGLSKRADLDLEGDEEDAKTAATRKTPLKIPSEDKVEQLYLHDESFRQRIQADNNVEKEDGSLNIDALSSGQRDYGQVVVETPKETMKRKRDRARRFEAGKAVGVFEAHTNLPHISLDTQPTTSETSRIHGLPYITTTKGPGSRWIWPAEARKTSIITGRTVGDYSRAMLSVEFVFEGATEGGEEELKNKRQMVLEAEEWAKNGESLRI